MQQRKLTPVVGLERDCSHYSLQNPRCEVPAVVMYVSITLVETLVFEPDVSPQDNTAWRLAKCKFIETIVMSYTFDFRWVIHQPCNYRTYN
jgi:hypothetical protein